MFLEEVPPDVLPPLLPGVCAVNGGGVGDDDGFFACAPHLLSLPAVGKVSKPRRGHPLVEFLIELKMGRFAHDDRAYSRMHTRIKG